MGRSRGRTSISVLVLTALLSGACDTQPPSDAAPVTTAPDVTTTDATAPPETADDPPSTSAGATPTLPPTTTQLASASPSSETPDDASAAAAETDDPPTSEPPTSEPPQETEESDAEVSELERIVTAVEPVLSASYPDRTFELMPNVIQGDLSGDGVDDFVIHVIDETPGSPPSHFLLPVVDTGGAFRLRALIELGQDVIVEAIDISDGGIEVALFDRSPYEPPTLITRRTTLAISINDAEADAEVTVTRVEPINYAPSLQITRPPTPARFELDGIGTAMSDQIALRERHPYVIHASEDDVVVATLEAPAGVWLEARRDSETVLVPIAEHTQRFATRLPAGGAWHVTVASSLIEPADYRFSIEVYPSGLGDGIATRDLNGFWSGTPITPPAVPDDGPVVYLTFDDGPHPVYTPRTLDVLAKHGAQATFFVVGFLAEQWPLIVQRIAHEGHTLANHSWDHRSLARMSRAAFDRSVGRTEEVLGPLATPCIRPPYYDVGRYTQQWAAEHGLKLASWSYSPQDWLGPSAQTIANGIVARSKQGAVILLHDGGGPRSSTVRGLDLALGRLADSGLEFKALCR